MENFTKIIPQVHAQEKVDSVGVFVERLYENLVDPILAILFVIALFSFIVFVIKFMKGGAEGEKTRAANFKGLLYSLLGLTLIVSAYGVITFVGRVSENPNFNVEGDLRQGPIQLREVNF